MLYISKENEDKEEKVKHVDGIYTLIIFQIFAMIVALIVIFMQNIYNWYEFGILKHNEYYYVRTGVFKHVAFMKTMFGSGLFMGVS